ncbi:hypothetical protein [Jannaschia sp. W003]|uniref:capsular polysaccharide export protein, LipB/KpsS family n=1 Tax=Jannaschia sp. W003 TaxID=2867012 RepID=UPI0021A677E2|nr:hypothetical protein [Jannaschia sp. W003]UWQ22020.1 hypothetical protein K3554_03015 [Jannaschia sp. W003]
MRLLVVSTAKNTDAILEHLKREPDVEVALHIGHVTADIKASALTRMNTREGGRGHLMRDARYTGAARALIESPQVAREMEMFADHLHRRAPMNSYKAHPLRSMQDYTDYFHILADAMAERLRSERIDHCLFFNVPHLGYDTVCYLVARTMGIPCTIVSQSLFPNRFWSMHEIAHMGGAALGEGAEPWPIEKGSKPDLFYMAGIKQEREEGGRITAKGALQLATFLVTQGRWRALNPAYVARLVRHMNRVYGRLPKWRDPFARFFHEDALAYFDHLAGYEDNPVDLSGDYVYFPLQLQPEMTTSSLGGAYRDQALAIEHLSAILPEGARILVKENPKQGSYMRGPLFWHRLRRIPNVEVLPSWADTHALTGGARFVAAITGTVGWEAVRQGVPALVFGKAWYRKLPGVVEWRDDLRWDDVAGLEWDHAALERATGALVGRMHEGVVDRHYERLVEGFDAEASYPATAKVLAGLLRGERAVTFDRD